MRFTLYFLYFMLLIVLVGGCSPQAERVQRHERTSSRVQAAAISNNGEFSLVSTTEEGLRLYDTQSSKMLHHWQQEEDGISQIVAIDFSEDASVALAASRTVLVLWDTSSGAVLGAWRNDTSELLDVAVSNQGQHIVLARRDGVVVYFEPNTGRRVEFTAHTDRVNQVVISANGQYVLSGGNDHQAILWQTNPVTILHTFKTQGRITKLTFDTKGTLALISSAEEAQIRHLVTGQLVQKLRFPRQKVFTSAVFSKNNQWLLTGTASRLVELWDTKSGRVKCQWRVKGQPDDYPIRAAILGLAFLSPQQVAIESSAGYGEIWQLPPACQTQNNPEEL